MVLSSTLQRWDSLFDNQSGSEEEMEYMSYKYSVYYKEKDPRLGFFVEQKHLILECSSGVK